MYGIEVEERCISSRGARRSEPGPVRWTLAKFKEPAGTQKEQFRQRKQKIDDTVPFLWKVPLSRSESWTFYFGYYLPSSVTYPLSSSHFTSTQLDSIQKKALSILLAHCGYNRNMKRAVVFGPLEFGGGAGFLRLYDHQGIGQVTSFIRNWRKGTVAGQLLRVLIAWCNFSVGMGSLVVVSDAHTPLPHLEYMWIGSLRIYLASVRAWLETDETLVAPSTCSRQLHHGPNCSLASVLSSTDANIELLPTLFGCTHLI